jgi:hypothetical protein
MLRLFFNRFKTMYKRIGRVNKHPVRDVMLYGRDLKLGLFAYDLYQLFTLKGVIA